MLFSSIKRCWVLNMGFIRIYLALCVVNSHAGDFMPWSVPRGRDAVEFFFIISGFYMAMISGRYSSIQNFYSSRWLRIAVPYYWHFAIIVFISTASGIFLSQWLALDAYAKNLHNPVNGIAGVLISTLTNFTILGQDAILFLKDNTGSGLTWTQNFRLFSDPLHRYLIIPQCWSVAVELCFYLLAPLLNRLRNLQLFLLVFVLLVARLSAYYFGFDHDPWVYRFLPFELGLFAFGMLIWRSKSLFQTYIIKSLKYNCIVYILICITTIFMGFIFRELLWRLGCKIGEPYAAIFLLLIFAPFILIAFSLTADNRFDRLIGELSYPIYLNHLFIILTLRSLATPEFVKSHIPILSAILSVALAWILYHFYLRKFEERRHLQFGVKQLA